MRQRTTLRREAAPASLGAAAADVPRPFRHQTTCFTAVATRAATVKYRTTLTKNCALVELLDLCVSSEIVSNEVCFKFLEKLRERSPLARRAVRASSAAFPLSPHEPACHVELSAFQSKVQSSLCPSSSAVVINDGDDVPPAWWCESCRQTTLVDVVVLRSAPRIRRAAFLR